MELYIFPWVGAKPIRSITAPDLLTCLRRLEDKGTLDTAHRAKQQGALALHKLKTGGTQTLVVQHVHVGQGGQAIVGNVLSQDQDEG
jgi:hypothetical protein